MFLGKKHGLRVSPFSTTPNIQGITSGLYIPGETFSLQDLTFPKLVHNDHTNLRIFLAGCCSNVNFTARFLEKASKEMKMYKWA